MNDPLLVLGLLSLGALTVLVAIGCVGAWWCRGHRLDITGLRIVSARPSLPVEPLIYTNREGAGPRYVVPKEPDLYDLAHGRGEDDQR